jgi:serine/threonine-protein phosphatase 2A regulatory subunit A
MEKLLALLSSDDAAVRLSAVQQIGTIPVHQRPNIFAKLSDDFDRSVRLAAASVIQLCPVSYGMFLADPDPQVQIAIINQSVAIRTLHPDPPSVLAAIISSQLVQSVSDKVRYRIACVLADHAKVDPEPDQVITKFLPVIEAFIREPEDTIRIASALAVKGLSKVFGLEWVLDHVPIILQKMISDSQWRVRMTAVELLSALSVISSLDLFNENLFQFVSLFLKDHASRVRYFVITGLPALVEHFGREWLTEKLLPSLSELRDSPNFLQREAYLMSISLLMRYFPERYRSNFVFQPIIGLLNDGVANVVVMAMMLLSEHLDHIHPFRRQCELRPILESLVEGVAPTTTELARALLRRLSA